MRRVTRWPLAEADILEHRVCVADDSLADPEIGYESGYKTCRRGAIMSSGTGLRAQLQFNV